MVLGNKGNHGERKAILYEQCNLEEKENTFGQ